MTQTRSRSEIESLAESLGRKNEIYDESGRADVVALVQQLGGNVHVDDAANQDSPASLTVKESGEFTVIVPWNTSVVRDRFTIAHEIGHLKLHYEDGTAATFYRFGRSRQETQANLFAAALLMPKEAFSQEFAKCDGDIDCLAKKFEVSRATTDIRAQVLGLK